MNHCRSCGKPVSRGRTGKHASDRKHAYSCLVCIQARVLRGWRYVSPAMKRWQKRLEAKRGT